MESLNPYIEKKHCSSQQYFFDLSEYNQQFEAYLPIYFICLICKNRFKFVAQKSCIKEIDVVNKAIFTQQF